MSEPASKEWFSKHGNPQHKALQSKKESKDRHLLPQLKAYQKKSPAEKHKGVAEAKEHFKGIGDKFAALHKSISK